MACATVLITRISSAGLVLFLMAWAMFAAGGFVVVSLRAAAQRYPKEQTAMIGGIDAGSWSAFVAFLLPQLGKLFEAKDYATAFNTTALLPVVGVVICWMVTPRLRSN